MRALVAALRWTFGLLLMAGAVVFFGMFWSDRLDAGREDEFPPLRPCGSSAGWPVARLVVNSVLTYCVPKIPLPHYVADENGPGSDEIPDPEPVMDRTSDCPEPPGEAEIWEKIPIPARAGFGVQRSNAEFRIVKVGHYIESAKIYPVVGPMRRVRCRYKCTVKFVETRRWDGPTPNTEVENRIEVVYLDKERLIPPEAPPGGPVQP